MKPEKTSETYTTDNKSNYNPLRNIWHIFRKSSKTGLPKET